MRENDTELIEHLRKSSEDARKNIEFLELHLAEFTEKDSQERIKSIMSQLAFIRYCDNKHLEELTGKWGGEGRTL